MVVLVKAWVSTVITGENIVLSMTMVKYLSITIVTKISFLMHIENTADKTVARMFAIHRPMANTEGPFPEGVASAV